MNFPSVLIITYDRSGSTLLQGILNSIDGCLIRGENNGFCLHLFLAQQHPERHSNGVWYGAGLFNQTAFLSH